MYTTSSLHCQQENYKPKDEVSLVNICEQEETFSPDSLFPYIVAITGPKGHYIKSHNTRNILLLHLLRTAHNESFDGYRGQVGAFYEFVITAEQIARSNIYPESEEFYLSARYIRKLLHELAAEELIDIESEPRDAWHNYPRYRIRVFSQLVDNYRQITKDTVNDIFELRERKPNKYNLRAVDFLSNRQKDRNKKCGTLITEPIVDNSRSVPLGLYYIDKHYIFKKLSKKEFKMDWNSYDQFYEKCLDQIGDDPNTQKLQETMQELFSYLFEQWGVRCFKEVAEAQTVSFCAYSKRRYSSVSLRSLQFVKIAARKYFERYRENPDHSEIHLSRSNKAKIDYAVSGVLKRQFEEELRALGFNQRMLESCSPELLRRCADEPELAKQVMQKLEPPVYNYQPFRKTKIFGSPANLKAVADELMSKFTPIAAPKRI
jgi:hypothetical protein